MLMSQNTTSSGKSKKWKEEVERRNREELRT